MLKAKRLIKRSRRNIILSIVFIVFGLSILWSDLTTLIPKIDILCQYVYDNGTTSTQLLEKNSNVPSRSIFFLVTSCDPNLTSRHYCAIESAALSHPEWQINILFSGPISSSVDNFLRLNNIIFWRIHITEFVKGTPFEEFGKSDALKNCRWALELNRDMLKYMLLSKWGGIYLNLDMIVARPLGSLVRNWASRTSNNVVGEEVLAISRDSVGRNVSEIAIREIQSILKRRHCGSVRPMVMMNVLQRFCSTPDAAFMSSATCNGFEVYGPQFFHPVPENRALYYFVQAELETNNAYTYNLWEHFTKKYKVMRSSPYSKLARRYCPLTFKLFYDQFGF